MKNNVDDRELTEALATLRTHQENVGRAILAIEKVGLSRSKLLEMPIRQSQSVSALSLTLLTADRPPPGDLA